MGMVVGARMRRARLGCRPKTVWAKARCFWPILSSSHPERAATQVMCAHNLACGSTGHVREYV